MRVISCNLQNFASYKTLNFDFNDRGLCLVEGPTGSGKSTLCDAIPWILFGKTAKNGAVDEILSWPGDQVTKGILHIELDSSAVIIQRSRGAKSKDNDFFYYKVGGAEVRGKDLLDTQCLLNNLLGVDSDLYLSGSYFHEFSQTAQFFTTTAKNRRAICEQIIDLSLAKKLDLKLAETLKENRNLLYEVDISAGRLRAELGVLNKINETESFKYKKWEETRTSKKIHLETTYDKYEINRKKPDSGKCPTCGAKIHTKLIVDNSENPYLEQLASLEREDNPHSGTSKDYSDEIITKTELLEEEQYLYAKISNKINDLEILQSVNATFRSILVNNTITYVENQTNEYLTEYFDSEVKINFKMTDNKLEVEIQKDGNLCSYSQLSKGQRQLLKLCFGVSVMKGVSNHHGVKFHQLFFDEAFDGLDGEFKTKVFRMLQTIGLQYESVFVVEHSSEIKSLFDTKYSVQLINGSSIIEKT